jgi:hypothetical protein
MKRRGCTSAFTVVADARVPQDVVEGAMPETARIYQHIGIDVVFVDEPSADTSRCAWSKGQ